MARTIENLVNIEVTPEGTVLEEIEIICTMTGFRRIILIHHLGDGYYQSTWVKAA